jgi:Rieske Fe-S protein
MHPVLVRVDDLDRAGKYKLNTDARFADVFVCRIRHAGAVPDGAVDLTGGECLVAFSRLCTHLGCHVAATPVPGSVGQLPTLPGEQDFSSVVLCPCHFSSFELARQGLVILGPATDCLPQIELRRYDATQVELVRWMRHPKRSIPYGVPFGGTSNSPPEHQ